MITEDGREEDESGRGSGFGEGEEEEEEITIIIKIIDMDGGNHSVFSMTTMMVFDGVIPIIIIDGRTVTALLVGSRRIIIQAISITATAITEVGGKGDAG